MTAVADPVYGRAEPERDRYGRYLIIPDGEKKAVPHTRATTVAGALDNRHSLEAWGKRQVLLGAARRPDILTRAAACTPDDKQLLDQLVTDCETVAANDAKANIGSALHSFCEQADLGQRPQVPAPYDQDVAAWQKACADAQLVILPELVEQICVLAEDQVAGTFDRVVELGNHRYILDLKTGSVDYSWGKNAVQLAIYAHGNTIYDPARRKHLPMPDVDRDLALIAHLPAGQGRCQLYWLDIRSGWDAYQHCMFTRAWQRRSDLHQAWQPGEATEALGARRVGLVARIQTLAFYQGALDVLAGMWPPGIPTFKASDQHTTLQLDAVDAVLVEVERRYQAPFGPLDPAHTVGARPS